jgi:raffinose/stachyose/melibiose transport system substrate-binding protein
LPIIKRKIHLAKNSIYTEVIDTVLQGEPDEILNTGIQSIVAGKATPEEVARAVENSLRIIVKTEVF